MNPLQKQKHEKALQIYNLLIVHADFEKPLIAQLSKLFIPFTATNQVLLRTSLKGKVCSYLHYPWKKTSQDLKIKAIFAESISILASRINQTLDEKSKFRLMELYYDLMAEGIPISSDLEEVALTASAETIELQELKKRKENEKWERVKSLSFLRSMPNPGQWTQNMEPAQLSSLLNHTSKNDFDYKLKYLKQFLSDHPEWASVDFQDKIKQLEAAQTLNQRIIDSANHSLDSDIRSQAIENFANQMMEQIQGLDANQKEKKMLFFGYGNPEPNFKMFLSRLRLLPQKELDQLPPFLKKYIDSNKDINPHEIIDELIKTCKRELKIPPVPTEALHLNPEDFSFVFGNKNRSLPYPLTMILPDLLQNYLNHFLKDGVLGNGAHLISNPILKSTLQWFAHEGKDLVDHTRRDKFIAELETQFTTFLHDKINTLSSACTAKLADQVKELQEILSDNALELTNLDCLLFGPIWIEFQKMPNSTYNLAIYSLGDALNNHPVNAKTGKPYCVLRLQEVQKDKLNTPFFKAMLSRYLDPLCNSNEGSKAEDVYAGPLDSLGGLKMDNRPEDVEIDHKFPSSAWRMVETLLFKSTTSEQQPILEFYMDGLLKFCNPYMNGPDGSLEIPNEEVCNALENALGSITKELARIPVDDNTTMKIARIKATIEEIRQSIALFKQNKSAFQFKDSINDTLRTFLGSKGVSKELILSIRDFFSWSFGDEAGDFIDYIFNHYKDVIPEKAIPSKAAPAKTIYPQHAKGWAFDSYLGIYISMAKSLAKIILLAAGLYTGGFGIILTLPFVWSAVLASLPPEWLAWYTEALNTIKIHLTRAFFKLIWNYALNDHARQQLTVLLNTWSKKAQAARTHFKKINTVSWEMDSPLSSQPLSSSPIQYRKKFSIPKDALPTVTYSRNPFANVEDLPPRMIHPESSKEFLHFSNNSNLDNDLHLNFILRLEMPSPLSTWSRIKKPEFYLKIIEKTLNNYGKFFDFEIHSSIYQELSSQNCKKIFAYLHLKIIVDYLSDRCAKENEIRKNKTPLKSPFNQKIKSAILTIYQQSAHKTKKPWLLEYYQKICRHLMPHLDRQAIEDFKEIKKPSIYEIAPVNIKTIQEIRETIRSWIKDPNPDQIQKISHQILQLAIPSSSKSSLWDTVENPEECLELLSDLSIYLYQTKEQQTKDQLMSKDPDNATFILSMYHLQSIMLCLAKRCPDAHLEELTVNSLPLLTLYQSHGSVIDEPLFLEKFQNILTYLMPGIDLNQEMNPSQIDEYKRSTLFGYTKPVTFGLETLAPKTCVESFKKGNLSFISYSEQKYLDELLKDPATDQKLRELGFDDSFDENEKACLLFQESFVFNRQKPLLSRSFNLLKLHTMLCHTINEEWLESISKKFKDPRTFPAPIYSKQEMFKQDRWMGVSYSTKVYSYLNHLESLAIDPEFQLHTAWDHHNRTEYLIPENCRAEPEIINNHASTFSYKNIDPFFHDSYIFEIASKHPSELISHFVHYLRKHDINNSKNTFSNFYERQKNELMRISYLIFFKPGALKEMIQRSPQSIQMFGELFNELFTKSKDSRSSLEWVIDLGSRVQQYCEFYCPGSTSSFPQFHIRFKQLSNYTIAYALSFDSPDQIKDPSILNNGVQAFLNALFKIKDINPFVKDRFYQKYAAWKKEIEHQLQDPIRRNAILYTIANNHHWIPRNESWKMLDTMVFIRGDLIIDLNVPELRTRHMDAQSLKILLSNSRFKKVGMNLLKMKRLESNIPDMFYFESPDGCFQIRTNAKNAQTENVFQIFKGKTYISFDDDAPLDLMKHLSVKFNKGFNCWVEINSDPRSFLVQSRTNIDDFEIFEDVTDIQITGSYTPLVKLEPQAVFSAKYIDHIAPLVRFDDAIQATAIPGQRHLHAISLMNKNLQFIIEKNESGEYQANSTQFPGFHIAAHQEHPALKGIASFLILENQQGRKKVLINDKQWFSGVASRFLSLTGPLEDFLINKINFKSFSNSSPYKVFEIVEDSSTLQSSNPESLLYLLTLYLSQGKKDKIEPICQQIEWLCHSQPLPASIWHYLYFLTIPTEYEDIGYLRRRLFSAVELNRLCFPESQSDTTNADNNDIQCTWTALITLLDLNQHLSNNNPLHTLSRTQELFLFKSAFNHLKSVLFNKIKPNKTIKQLIESVGWDTIMEILILPPKLGQRYIELKKEAGLPNSASKKIFEGLINIWSTPSSLHPLSIDPNTRDQAQIKNSTNHILSIIKRLSDVLLNLNQVNALQVHAGVKPKIRSTAPLDIETFKPIDLKRFFISYYSILHDSTNPLDRLSDSRSVNKSKLMHLLKMHKGSGNKDIQFLAAVLESVAACPSAFPSTADLLKIHKKSSILIKRAKGNFSWDPWTPWSDLFSEFKTLVFKVYLSKNIIDPPLKQLTTQIGADYIASIFTHIIPPQLSISQITQLPAQAAAAVASDVVRTHLRQALEPAQQIIPNFSETFIKNASINKKNVLNAGVKVAITLLALYKINSIIGSVQNNIKETLCTSTDFLLSGSKCLEWTSPSNLAYAVKSHIASTAAIFYTRKKFKLPVEWMHILPYPMFTVPLLKLASKTKNAFEKQSQIEQKRNSRRDKPPLPPVDFSFLKEEDKKVDDFLNDLFNLAFVEETTDVSHEKRAQLIPIKNSDNPVYKDKIQKVNESIQAYYNQPDRTPTTISLVNPDALADIFIKLRSFQQTFSKQIEVERTELLSAFKNAKSSFGDQQPITLTLLHQYIEKAGLKQIDEEDCLSADELTLLKKSLARINLLSTRLQQLERLSNWLGTLSKSTDKTSKQYHEIVEQIALELKVRTAFSLEHTPERLLWLDLQFEAATGTKLWKRQAENRQKALYAVEGDVVTEEPPGDGKTFYGIPITAAHELLGDQLVMILAPKQLAGDNQPKIAAQLRTIFNKISYALSFSRDKFLKAENLEALLALFTFAKESGEPIQLTKEDAQTLRAMFDDRLYQYFHTEGRNSSNEKHCLVLLHKILQLIFTSGLALPDEAHEAYSHRHQLNLTVGKSKGIDTNFYVVMEATMRIIIKDLELRPFIQNNELFKINEKNYHDIIKPRIAQAMSRYWRFKLGEDSAKRADMIAFVCEQTTEVPAWLKENYLIYQQVSLIKGILNVLFPMNFKNRSSVDYMPSQKNNGEFARPSDGNSHVVEQDSIQSPYETLIKTMLMIFSNGLDPKQFEEFYKIFVQRVEREKRFKPGMKYEDTNIFKMFGNNLSFHMNEKEKAVSYEKLKSDPNAHIFYIRYHVMSQIRYWKKSIQNNAQDFASMFHRSISCTGTPFNDGTYPAWMKMLRDPTTIGELLHLIYQKCPKNGIHILDGGSPKKILEEILTKYFSSPIDYKFSAIIDGGAQFTGMSNEDVAKEMIAFCQKHRPDIKAVKFFKEDETGKEQVYCFINGNDTPLPVASIKLDPADCLTYYDQRHGFGADIKQTGDGLETMGPNHPLYRWLQELFRIRGLKKQARLKALQELTTMQNIHICMTKDIQKRIMETDQNTTSIPHPTLADIVDYALRNEAAIAEEENFSSMRRKIATAIKNAINKKIMEMDPTDFNKWTKVWKEFETIFISENEDDPAKTFGLIKTKVSSKEALEAAAKEAYHKIAASALFSDQEKGKILESIIKLAAPVMPEEATVWCKEKGKPIELGSMDSLGSTQTIEMSQQQNEETEQMNQIQLNTEMEQNLRMPCLNASAKCKYTEWEWPEIKDYASLDWFKISSPQYIRLRLVSLRKKPSVPFFSVRDLLKRVDIKEFRQAASYFDSRLWMSNNFVPRHARFNDRNLPVNIGHKHQFALNNVLIHFEEKENGTLEILKMGPLSTRDASQLRKKIPSAAEYWEGKKIKTVIWDVHSRTIQGGCPLKQSVLRSHQDLKLLAGQLKMLDGMTNLKHEKQALVRWLKQLDNPQSIKFMFNVIHNLRQFPSYQNSIAEQLFIDAIPDSSAEERV